MWQYLNGSSGLKRLCQSGTLGLALDTNCSFVINVTCADARFLFRPRRTSVAINPSEVLHQAGVTMVNGTLGSLTATEAQAFDAVMGEFGASDGGV